MAASLAYPEVVSLHLPGKTEKNHDKISPKIVCGLRIKPRTEGLRSPGSVLSVATFDRKKRKG
jgi:hypothetical protein